MIVVRGAGAGPTLWVQAGLHGDEGDGVVAVLRWLDALDAGALQGTVIAVPVVNTPAFLAGAAANPVDGRNLNRSFGGERDTWTERFAGWLLSRVARDATAFVDLHGGGRGLEVADFAFYADDQVAGDDDAPSRRLALASGVRFVCAPPSTHARALYQVLGARGIPAVLIEAGGGTTWREAAVARHVRALDSILSAMGMVPAAADARERVPATAISRTVELYSSKDAIVVDHAAPGTLVRRGEPVVQLHDLTGRPIAAIASPLPSAIVLSVAASALLRTGGYACLLGESAA